MSSGVFASGEGSFRLKYAKQRLASFKQPQPGALKWTRNLGLPASSVPEAFLTRDQREQYVSHFRRKTLVCRA